LTGAAEEEAVAPKPATSSSGSLLTEAAAASSSGMRLTAAASSESRPAEAWTLPPEWCSKGISGNLPIETDALEVRADRAAGKVARKYYVPLEEAADTATEQPSAAAWSSSDRWLNEEERLRQWFWLSALGVGPRDSWLDRGVRAGRIRTWLSETAMNEIREQVRHMGLRPNPTAHYFWLKDHWLPFFEAKRATLKEST